VSVKDNKIVRKRTTNDECSVGIVIVNWNAGVLLKACIDSLLSSNFSDVYLERIVIVDNGSTDGSLNQISNNSGHLEFIRNSDNLGFAKACNKGASSLESDYILFLNPDTICEPNSIASVISFMNKETSRNIGICGTALYSEKGKFGVSCARFPKTSLFFFEAFGLTRLFPAIFKPLLLSNNECKKSGYVDQVIGAFFLVRRKLFNDLDGFDERFFVYFEEVDFSLRASQLGQLSYFLSDISNYHLGGGSSGSVVGKRLYYSLSSRLKYAKKHFRKVDYILLSFLTICLEPFSRLFYSAVRLNRRELLGTFEGYKLFFCRNILRKIKW
jgi:N-acetylglucosaminyl-diphospho-decaprenol L-rhamnosyltransferase